MNYSYVATCLFGLESSLGAELDALGLKRTFTMDGRVYFEGDESACARANIGLRCAERVYLHLGSFRATTFTELFDGVMALPWESFIGSADAFPVKGHSIRSRLFSVPDCQKIIKKAVVKRLSEAYRKEWFEETGVRYQIEFFLFKDEAALMLDTTGTPLHKRGYRPASGAAPLRETLASGLVRETHLKPDILLWDPFCGSGTIAIEAAMQQLHIAPGLKRDFAGMQFPWLGEKLFSDEKQRCEAEIRREDPVEIWASDLDPSVLKLARENAKRAGVEKHIRFFEADARKLEKPDRKGTVLCNPPYGERLMDQKSAEELYRDLSFSLGRFAPWQVYILTSCENFEFFYRQKADRAKKVYNGMIPCHLFEFYKPKDNAKKAKPAQGRQG
ncbi:MAG: class I SAM-dependent RNA methyltransferase [Clostridia bacterium]|nr:class I SAM-dependent RNA methyltransferase [Clostridia bacterium]